MTREEGTPMHKTPEPLRWPRTRELPTAIAYRGVAARCANATPGLCDG